MRQGVIAFTVVLFFLISCGDGKVYQEYVDFKDRSWNVADTARFDFSIPDTVSRYNLFCNIRNSTHYPFARIFINFSLADTTGNHIHDTMVNDFLFDPKSGKPMGKTGLGDLYDHQLVVLKNYKFKNSGPYQATFEQMMRTDTLSGIISVGFGIEKVVD